MNDDEITIRMQPPIAQAAAAPEFLIVSRAGVVLLRIPADSELRLCSLSFRRSIVGFRAHGQYKHLVTEIVRSKREVAA